MSDISRKLEEIEKDLLKQKKRTKRLLKLNKAFDIGDKQVGENNLIERIQKLEV